MSVRARELAIVAALVLGACDRAAPAPPPVAPVAVPDATIALDLVAPDVAQRVVGFERLAAAALADALRLVLELLHHEPDDELRTRVRAWVVGRSFAQIAKELDALLASDHPEARAWLAAALGAGDDEPAARRAALLRLALDADARVRLQASAGILALEERAELGPDPAPLALTRTPEGAYRLGRGQPIAEVHGRAAARDPWVRARAAEAAQRCPPNEEDWRVRAAAEPLGMPPPATARPAAVVAGRYAGLPDPRVAAAARWLVRHQDADGSWDGVVHNPLGVGPLGVGGLPGFAHELAYARPALTGLGLLALLQAGAYPGAGRLGIAAAHAAEYLLAHQTEDGRVGLVDDEASVIAHAVDSEGRFPPKPLVALFNHAIGAWALVELAVTTQELEHARAASAALRVLAVERHHRHPWSRWFDPTDDVAYAGYAILALLVERAAGERWSDGELLDEAAQYLRYVTRPDGRVYHESVRPHCFGGYDSSATGLFLRGLLPLDMGEAEPHALAMLLDNPPVWNDRYPIPRTVEEIGDDQGLIANVHLWHFGALAAARCPGDDRARAWTATLASMLAEHQRDAPWADAGAWDPVDPWGRVGGRVYATAVSMLAQCALTAYRWGR